MALLAPLRECLGRLVTSELWMEEITTVGRDGQRFDLGRAEQLMDAVERAPAVRDVAGSREVAEGSQIAEVLDNFFGQLEARFVDGRTVDARPRAKEVQRRISVVLDSLAVAVDMEPEPTRGGGWSGMHNWSSSTHDHAANATLCRTPTQALRAESDMPDMLAENEAKVEGLCRRVQALAAEREAVLKALQVDEDILMGAPSHLLEVVRSVARAVGFARPIDLWLVTGLQGGWVSIHALSLRCSWRKRTRSERRRHYRGCEGLPRCVYKWGCGTSRDS
jgi:hypothetical protein